MINRYALHEETTSLNMVMLRSGRLPLGRHFPHSAPCALVLLKNSTACLLYRRGCPPWPSPTRRCRIRSLHALFSVPASCPHPPRPSRRGRPALAPHIHLALLAGRGGMHMHLHTYPPHAVDRKRRPVPLGDAKFKMFWAFSDMLQAYVSSVLVISDVCFKCLIRMLQK
jgi:hypothetical protein